MLERCRVEAFGGACASWMVIVIVSARAGVSRETVWSWMLAPALPLAVLNPTF